MKKPQKELIMKKSSRLFWEKGYAELFADVDEKMTVFSIASMITRTRLWYSPKGRLSVNDIIDFIFNFALNALKRQSEK